MLATLIRESAPLGSPWHPVGPAGGGQRLHLARGVWILRTKRWVHAGRLDTHADLPSPVVDYDDVNRLSWYVPDWHAMALCGGLPFAAFFGAANDERPTMKRSEVTAARAICAGCPVKRECLDWSLAKSEAFGVWGGTSGRQRMRMRADMRAGTTQATVIDEWFTRWLTTAT